MKYHQLTAAVRGSMEVLIQEQYSVREIGRKLGIAASTVSREIHKRGMPSGYSARIAQEHYERIRRQCRQRKKCLFSNRQKYIVKKLELGWSPEQIAGRLKRIQSPLYVCKETLYQFLYTDTWAKEEKLYQYLRYGRKKSKKVIKIWCSGIVQRDQFFIQERTVIMTGCNKEFEKCFEC